MSKLRFLIVEDDDVSALVFEKQLAALEVEILRVTLGVEFLRVLAEQTFDLAIVDLRLPDMNGLECIRILRELGLALPVLVVSAYAMSEDRDAAMAAGADGYPAKPYTREAFLGQVSGLVGRV